MESSGDVEIRAVRLADVRKGRLDCVVGSEQIDVNDRFECIGGQAGDGREAGIISSSSYKSRAPAQRLTSCRRHLPSAQCCNVT